MTDCPANQQLFEFLKGRLSEKDADMLVSHVDECANCQATIEKIDNEDSSLIASIQDAVFGQAGQYAAEKELQAAIQHFVKNLDHAENDHLDTLNQNFSQTSTNKELGDFRIIRELGRGGMGVVYEADQLSLGRRVALKVRPFAALLDKRRIKRFENEARAAATLEHPHIVTVYAVGADRGIHYIAMRYIDGPNLSTVIANAKSEGHSPNQMQQFGDQAVNPLSNEASSPLEIPKGSTVEWASREQQQAEGVGKSTADPSERDTTTIQNDFTTMQGDFNIVTDPVVGLDFQRIAKLALQAASAVEYAHKNGVVHRDIKPSNLLIDELGHLWVTDFGLARIDNDDNLTATGDILGTLNYMSPEQASGQTELVDRRTDIYSLGATLYELLTLQPVFQGQNREKMLLKVASQEPVPPKQINPAVPIDLETITLKAIAKEIDDRYRTAGELAADLQRFIERRPILATRPTKLERIGKWVRRHRAISAASIVGLIAISGISLFLVTLFMHQNSLLRRANENWVVAEREQKKALAESERSAEQAYNYAYEADNANYASQFAAIREQIRKQDPVAVSTLLDKLAPSEGRPDLRGVEWGIAKNLISAQKLTVPLSSESLYTLEQSHDQQLLATAGLESQIYLVDSATLNVRRKISTDQIEINGLAFTPDDNSIASTGDDGSIKFWDVKTGNLTRSIDSESEKAFAVEYVLDGKLLMTSGDDNLIRLWDAKTGKRVSILEGHTEKIKSVAVDSTGQLIATSCKERKIVVWNLKTRSPVTTFHFAEHRKRVETMAFSPDNRFLFSGHISGVLSRWSLHFGRRDQVGTDIAPFTALTFNNDGSLLYGAVGDGALKTWECQAAQRPPQEMISHLTPAYESTPAIPRRPGGMAFSRDGQWTCTLGEKEIVFQHRSTGDIQRILFPELSRFDSYIRSEAKDLCEFSRDSRWLVMMNEVYRLEDGSWKHQHRIDLSYRRIFSVSFTSQTSKMLCGYRTGTVAVLNPQTGEHHEDQIIQHMDHGRPLFENDVIAISADDRRVATTTPERWILIVDPKTKIRVSEFQGDVNGRVLDFTFSSDGKFLATIRHDRNDALLWNVKDGIVSQRITFPVLQDNRLEGVAFSPDGKWLAVTSAGRSGSTHILDLKTNRIIWQQPRAAHEVEFDDSGHELRTTNFRSGQFTAWDLSELTDAPMPADSGISKYALSNEDMPTLDSHRQISKGAIASLLCLPANGNLIAAAQKNLLSSPEQETTTIQELVDKAKPGSPAPYESKTSVGNRAIAIANDKGLLLYEHISGKFLQSASLDEPHVSAVALSGNDRTLVTGDIDGTIWFRDLKTLKKTDSWTIDAGSPVENVVLTSDGNIMAVELETDDSQDEVRLFEVATRKRLPFPKIKNGERICFSRDDEWFAFTCLNDLYLWNLDDSTKNKQLSKHTDSIHSISFDPLKRYVATASNDRRIIIWSLQTGKEVHSLEGHTDRVHQVCFTPDGRSLFSGGRNGGIKIWHVATGQHLFDFNDRPSRTIRFLEHAPVLLEVTPYNHPKVTHFDRAWNRLSKDELKTFQSTP